MKIDTKVEIPDQRLQDLLCCAFEGGSNYWYEITSFNYPPGQTKQSLGIEFPHLEVPLLEGGSLKIVNFEENGDQPEALLLNRETIKEGLKVMAELYPERMAEFLAENEDAITGDCFLQCCLYGKVIFC